MIGGDSSSVQWSNPMIRRRSLMLLPLVMLAACTVNPVGRSKSCFHGHDYEYDIGFCQAVRVGDTLYISGTVGKGAMPDAIRMAYDSLQATLKAQGLGFQHVVSERVYTTDLDAFIHNKEIRKQYYAEDLPAATWVQVSRLYMPAFAVEVELIAEFPH
jgi:2-iminobutanoate/2-iminopropanoate deaminase